MFYEFADFRVDAKKRLLFRGDEQISLTPKVFETLLAFLDHPGEVLEKDRLMNLLWADSFVEESNLAQNVAVLRKALGENSKQHRFVLTIPGKGYRFVAAVSRVERENGVVKPIASHEAGSSGPVAILPFRPAGQTAAALRAVTNEPETIVAPEAPQPVIESRASRPISRYAVLIAAAALLTASLGFYYFFYAGKPVLNVSDKKSIAVLPLKPINSASRDEIFEIGIADSLILKLGSMNGFVVRPLSATRKYADIEQDSLAAGREQQVDYVLASNYQLAGGRIRITAQLFNVANGQIEETYIIEKGAGNVFAMQDAIADDVGNIFSARFGSTSSGATANRGTDNEEAYRLYLQGMYLAHIHTLSTSQKAVKVLERAVELDPDYAQAWAGKAYAHRAVANFIGRNVSTQEDYQKSMEAIKRALSLDANLAEAYSTLCENKMYYEYDFAEAESACKRGIELNPNSPLAHQVYSRYLISRGRFDEAITEIKTTIDLEPASLFYNSLYGINLYGS